MQLDRGDQYSELHHKFAGPEMLEFLAMPERLIGGVRRGCCPGIAPPPHVPEPEPLSLPVSRYFIDGREKGETLRVQTSAVAPCARLSQAVVGRSPRTGERAELESAGLPVGAIRGQRFATRVFGT